MPLNLAGLCGGGDYSATLNLAVMQHAMIPFQFELDPKIWFVKLGLFTYF